MKVIIKNPPFWMSQKVKYIQLVSIFDLPLKDIGKAGVISASIQKVYTLNLN